MSTALPEVVDPLDWFVPSADPLDAYHDPRASLPWTSMKDSARMPAPMDLLFQIRSALFMAGVTGLTRLLLAFHTFEIRHAYVLPLQDAISLP